MIHIQFQNNLSMKLKYKEVMSYQSRLRMRVSGGKNVAWFKFQTRVRLFKD